MSFRFRPDRDVAGSVLRVADKQFEVVTQRLATPDVQGIHATRKALKRLRALGDLVAPALDGEATTVIDRALRDAGRSLAARRDADVMVATLRALEADDDGVAVPALRSMRTALEASPRPFNEGAAVAEALHSIGRARLAFAALELDAVTWRDLVRGLGRSYRRARKDWRKFVDRPAPADEDFHEFRKRVQRHWRHLQLFALAWPDVMGARISLAKQLADCLGEDHDLAVVKLRAADDGLALAPLTRQFVQAKCSARQAALRSGHGRIAEKLFAEKANGMERTVMRYWQVELSMRGEGSVRRAAAEVVNLKR
jgi:CHAD domain-containing protein